MFVKGVGWANGSDGANGRLEALFVISITLGLRPGELRKLTWDHVDLSRGVVHVWRSASKTGDTKTPKSKRSLELPKGRQPRSRPISKAGQGASNSGEAGHDNNLVFCMPCRSWESGTVGRSRSESL
jgi:integrase